jgi:NADH:ubiquinone oxidoreductase subunit 6 (subunit J)
MLYVLLVVGAIFCAALAIRAKRLLVSALWLAGVSALVSIIFYLMGAYQVAVIELSVGAGLVTVLFVFAIGMVGEESTDVREIIPKPLAWGLVILSALLLGWLTLPLVGVGPPVSEPTFASVLWERRGLDVLVQMVLIFCGILGVLGLLAETGPPSQAQIGEATPETERTEQQEGLPLPQP